MAIQKIYTTRHELQTDLCAVRAMRYRRKVYYIYILQYIRYFALI